MEFDLKCSACGAAYLETRFKPQMCEACGAIGRHLTVRELIHVKPTPDRYILSCRRCLKKFHKPDLKINYCENCGSERVDITDTQFIPPPNNQGRVWGESKLHLDMLLDRFISHHAALFGRTPLSIACKMGEYLGRNFPLALNAGQSEARKNKI